MISDGADIQIQIYVLSTACYCLHLDNYII